ncbi:MAG: lycopene beta-cyclase [Kangiellaceae bacterium]|jgi:lycopene beta-cyclase
MGILRRLCSRNWLPKNDQKSLNTAPVAQRPIDLVIIGAGAAGLSLLLSLDEINYPHTVTLLERNAQPSNDRIWSFWHIACNSNSSKKNSSLPSYIESIISHKWSNWTLSTDLHSYSMNTSVYDYCSIRSEDLSALAHKRVNKNSNFNIIYNCDVTSIISSDEACLISTQHEQLVTSKIIDTRPPSINNDHSGLLQCFYGEEIIVSADIFDPYSVKLMQQLKCSELGIEFLYILPFSTNHALVEFTCFSPVFIKEDTLKSRLLDIINNLVKQHKYQIQRSESAVLPMYMINKNIHNTGHNSSSNGPNIIYGGIAGGAMRASTGYSFLNSQQWAKRCAKQLMHSDLLSKHAPINALYTKMDSIMLKVLRDDMNMGVTVFEQMFKRVKPDSFARFMIQQATFLDFVSVIWAMPKWRFFKAACKLLFVAQKAAHRTTVEKGD